MRFLAVLLLLVVVRAKNSNTTLEQRLARTIARVWKPISEEVVPQVFPGAEEQAVLECLSTPGKQIGNCTGWTKEDIITHPFDAQPLGGGLGAHSCPHLERGAVTHMWVDAQGNSPSLPSSVDGTWAARAWCALEGRSTVFVGDSTMLQTYQAYVMELKRNEGQLRGAGAYIHSVAVLANEPVSRERDGAITWWGNLDSVQRVEVSGSCGTHGNFSSVVRYVKMHVYADYDMDYVLANDVIFAWFGLHYHVSPPHLGPHRRAYAVDLAAFYSRLSTHLRGHPGRTLVVRSTLTQHFHTPTGDYYKRDDERRCCVPLPKGAPKQWAQTLPAHVAEHSLYKNLASDAEMPKYLDWHAGQDPAYYLLPLDELFGSRFDLQPGSWEGAGKGSDCTHYCWVPTLWHVVWEQLALVLEHDRDTRPGDVAALPHDD